MRTHRSVAGIALGLITSCLVASCDALEFECPGPVRLSTSTGTMPRFDWEPGCEATAFWVKDTESDVTMWAVVGEFRPPVEYGVVPKGAETLEQMKPLERGVSYEVEMIGVGPYGVQSKGDRKFRVH